MTQANESVIKNMYRYLEKYTGTYRVLAYYNLDTNDFPKDDNGCIDTSFEDLYIPCKKGIIKHTYIDNDILAICFYDKKPQVAKNVLKEIKDKYPKLDLTLDVDGIDSFIYFNANDIKKIATIIKPRTSGASIKWNSNKNLPKVDVKLPEDALKTFNDVIKNLDKTQKMQFTRACNSAFLDSISTKKLNHKEEMKISRMKVKEYIYSIGQWDKYINFLKKELKKI